MIKYTTTSVSTLTSTTTCTTSTAGLSACTAGRRRRGLFYDDGEAAGRNRRGLFYNDDEVENKDGSVLIARYDILNLFLIWKDNFIISNLWCSSDDPTKEVLDAPKKSADLVVPLEVQSGFTLPEGVTANRFLLTFGTSTVLSYVITTSTSSITATCSSVIFPSFLHF